MGNSVGFIETRGFVAAVSAADSMCKCADVEIISCNKIGSGRVIVCVEGEVDAVAASIESGIHAAEVLHALYSSNIIARPAEHIIAELANMGKHPLASKFKKIRFDEPKIDKTESIEKVEDPKEEIATQPSYPIQQRAIETEQPEQPEVVIDKKLLPEIVLNEDSSVKAEAKVEPKAETETKIETETAQETTEETEQKEEKSTVDIKTEVTPIADESSIKTKSSHKSGKKGKSK